jgi:hypothetical protein
MGGEPSGRSTHRPGIRTQQDVGTPLVAAPAAVGSPPATPATTPPRTGGGQATGWTRRRGGRPGRDPTRWRGCWGSGVSGRNGGLHRPVEVLGELRRFLGGEKATLAGHPCSWRRPWPRPCHRQRRRSCRRQWRPGRPTGPRPRSRRWPGPRPSCRPRPRPPPRWADGHVRRPRRAPRGPRRRRPAPPRRRPAAPPGHAAILLGTGLAVHGHPSDDLLSRSRAPQPGLPTGAGWGTRPGRRAGQVRLKGRT